jgi:laccase
MMILMSHHSWMDLRWTQMDLWHYSDYIWLLRQYSSEDPSVTGFDHVSTTAIIEYRGNYTIPSSPSFPSALPLYLDFMAALFFTSRIRSLVSKEHPIN